MEKYHQLASVLNSFRVFPRLFITAYIYVFVEVVYWFMAIENPTSEQAAFVSVIVGVGAAWFGIYVNSKLKKEND